MPNTWRKIRGSARRILFMAGADLVVGPERNALGYKHFINQAFAHDNVELVLDLPAKGFEAWLGTAAQLVRITFRNDRPNAVFNQAPPVGDFLFDLFLKFGLGRDHDRHII